jgi:Zn ribbon nucleic-acid-binding protein
MNCHSQIFSTSPFLEPVRASFRSGRSIEWTRVHDLPDFVYFDHSIHVNKGVGCTTCHGPVDRMPLMWQEQSLQMAWCVECHRRPEAYVRPRDAVFRVDYAPPDRDAQLALGRRLVAEYGIQPQANLTSCSTCHR